MGFVTTNGNIVKLWPGGAILPGSSQRATVLGRRVRAFFDIAAVIELTTVEQRILLDITARELAQVRLAPANALALCGAKLERRVNYAIPILHRMATSMGC